MHNLSCLLVNPDGLIWKSHVDVVHIFDNAIILHLNFPGNVYTFLILIVGFKVGRTASHHLAMNLSLNQLISDGTGNILSCPAPYRSGLNLHLCLIILQ
jgi:hypothetical protein